MNYKKLRNIFSNPIRGNPAKRNADALEARRTSSGTGTLIVQVIFVIVIAGVVFAFGRFYGREPSVFKNVPKNEAAVLIDFDNMRKVFAGEVIDGMTVLDALNASVAAGKIALTYYVDADNNTKIAKINDHEANDGERFIFYINSEKVDPGELNKTQIKSGDKITIRLE